MGYQPPLPPQGQACPRESGEMAAGNPADFSHHTSTEGVLSKFLGASTGYKFSSLSGLPSAMNSGRMVPTIFLVCGAHSTILTYSQLALQIGVVGYIDRTDVVNFDVIRIDELTDIEPAVIFFNDIGIDDIRFKESALRESFHQARKEAAYRANISGLFICCDCRPFAGSHRSM